MRQSTLTAKGQTTLPKDVRKVLGLQPGDKLRYILGRVANAVEIP
jgi:antitoxin PrlF